MYQFSCDQIFSHLKIVLILMGVIIFVRVWIFSGVFLIGTFIASMFDSYAHYHYINQAYPPCTYECNMNETTHQLVNKECQPTCVIMVIFVRGILILILLTGGYVLYWYTYLHNFPKMIRSNIQLNVTHSLVQKDKFFYYLCCYPTPTTTHDLESRKKLFHSVVPYESFWRITKGFMISYLIIVFFYFYEIIWFILISLGLILPIMFNILFSFPDKIRQFRQNNHLD
jgi:ABC-type multidrug transport system fused ATPase/permease subunit